MSVYLGTHGEVELQRQFDGSDLRSTINPSDVNATKKRFSFDFEHGQLLSGDQIEITSTDGTALDFIDSYTKTSVKKFIHVDELDGIRLYDSFANAVNGGTANATALATPANDLPIRVTVANAGYLVLAQVNGFELNTERETVDTTTLSDEFRSRISTLMSGSGRMSAFWEYTGNTSQELPNYLVELSLRTRVGSQFKARFYIKRNNHNPGGVAANDNDEIFYEFTGVLTGCAVQFAPNNTVQVEADFITTGLIQLRMDLEVPDKLVQENTDEILLEQGTADAILLEST
jgi:hypothetical protein|tara:strand:- start:51 stop:917 length:867 start_codon:yes stop_codon:yes gene_type:complete